MTSPSKDRITIDGFLQKLKLKLSEQTSPNSENVPISVSNFFTGTENQSNVSLPDFKKAFLKLNYDISTLKTIMNYFQDFKQTTLISLDKIKSEMEHRNLDSEYISEIQQAIYNHDKQLLSQFKYTKQYKQLALYNKLNSTLSMYIDNIKEDINSKQIERNKYASNTNQIDNEIKDKEYITYKDFCDVLDNYIVLNTQELEIVFENTESNANGDLNYYDFINKVHTFDAKTIDLVQRDFMLKHNAYIINIRAKLNEDKNEELLKSKCVDLTGNVFKPVSDKNFFACVKASIGENVNIEEIEYIYKILTCDGKEIINYNFIKEKLIIYGREETQEDILRRMLLPKTEDLPKQEDNKDNIEKPKPLIKIMGIIKKLLEPSTTYKWDGDFKQPQHIDDNDLSLDYLFKEYPKCDRIINAILKRLDNYSEIVNAIVYKHNVYFLYRAYACLCVNSTPYQIYMKCKEKDSENIGAVHRGMFHDVMRELTLKSLYQEQIDLLINDNKYIQKDNYCSYVELIEKMKQYNNKYHIPKRIIFQKAHLLFNPIVKQYRNYILNNNISYAKYFNLFAKEIKREHDVIDFMLFVKMNEALKYNFDNIIECLYLYEVLVYCNLKRLLTFKDYDYLFTIQLLSESDFIKEGEIIYNNANKQNESSIREQLLLNRNIQINMSNYKPYLNHLFQLGNIFKQQFPKFNINSPLELIEHYQCNPTKDNTYIPYNIFFSIMTDIHIAETSYAKSLTPFYDESNNINIINFIKILNILFPGNSPYVMNNYEHNNIKISFNHINFQLQEKQFKDIKKVSMKIYSIIFAKNKSNKTIYEYFKTFAKYNNDKETITIKQIYAIVLNDLNLYSELYHNEKRAFEVFVSFVKLVDNSYYHNENDDHVNVLTLSKVIERFTKKPKDFYLNNKEDILTKIVIN